MANWIHSSITFVEEVNPSAILAKLELATRNCYKSEDRIEEGSAERLIRNCIKRGHEAPLEHASLTMRFICDRAVSHELVRHRMASYCQESQRYCNYGDGKFSNQITFIYPHWYRNFNEVGYGIVFGDIEREVEDTDAYYRWQAIEESCRHAEQTYLYLLRAGAKPEDARAVLPNCTKTDVVCTMNIREIRHFLKLRTSKAAHPDIRKLANQLYHMMVESGLGVLVEDIEPYELS